MCRGAIELSSASTSDLPGKWGEIFDDADFLRWLDFAIDPLLPQDTSLQLVPTATSPVAVPPAACGGVVPACSLPIPTLVANSDSAAAAVAAAVDFDDYSFDSLFEFAALTDSAPLFQQLSLDLPSPVPDMLSVGAPVATARGSRAPTVASTIVTRKRKMPSSAAVATAAIATAAAAAAASAGSATCSSSSPPCVTPPSPPPPPSAVGRFNFMGAAFSSPPLSLHTLSVSTSTGSPDDTNSATDSNDSGDAREANRLAAKRHRHVMKQRQSARVSRLADLSQTNAELLADVAKHTAQLDVLKTVIAGMARTGRLPPAVAAVLFAQPAASLASRRL